MFIILSAPSSPVFLYGLAQKNLQCNVWKEAGSKCFRVARERRKKSFFFLKHLISFIFFSFLDFSHSNFMMSFMMALIIDRVVYYGALQHNSKRNIRSSVEEVIIFKLS